MRKALGGRYLEFDDSSQLIGNVYASGPSLAANSHSSEVAITPSLLAGFSLAGCSDAIF